MEECVKEFGRWSRGNYWRCFLGYYLLCSALILARIYDRDDEVQTGYDGCDVPFYGGHLLENFLSPLTNKRTDEYGGSLENRCRLIGEVLRAIRDAVGPDFIIGVRHSGDHYVPGGMSREDLLEVARLVDGLGI